MKYYSVYSFSVIVADEKVTVFLTKELYRTGQRAQNFLLTNKHQNKSMKYEPLFILHGENHEEKM